MIQLDPRFPTLIPLEALPVLRAPIQYTDEVGVRVRWQLSDYSQPEGTPVLVTTDLAEPPVQQWLADGASLIVAESIHQEQVLPAGVESVVRAQEVMHRARTIGEWERKQTHASLLPYLREETAEFAEAVRLREELGPGGEAQLKNELSDVLLQVLFHAELAAERNAFDLNDVAAAFVEKMRQRAPYLFDGTTDIVPEAKQEQLWKAGKQAKQKQQQNQHPKPAK